MTRHDDLNNLNDRRMMTDVFETLRKNNGDTTYRDRAAYLSALRVLTENDDLYDLMLDMMHRNEV